MYINILFSTLTYIACLCPNLVSVHFYAIPILHFKFPKFFIYLSLEGKSECVLCGAECESVVHVLWECSAYSNIRATFVEKLRELLGNRYAEFDKLNSIEKTAYILGSELWEYDFDDLLSLVKEYVVGVWDARKQKLYGDDLCPSQLQSLAEDLQLAGVEGQMDGKLCSSGEGGTDGKDLSLCACVCGSAHDCGCVVDGSNAMVAS